MYNIGRESYWRENKEQDRLDIGIEEAEFHDRCGDSTIAYTFTGRWRAMQNFFIEPIFSNALS
jgi:hypothetical protein